MSWRGVSRRCRNGEPTYTSNLAELPFPGILLQSIDQERDLCARDIGTVHIRLLRRNTLHLRTRHARRPQRRLRRNGMLLLHMLLILWPAHMPVPIHPIAIAVRQVHADRSKSRRRRRSRRRDAL